MQVSDNSPPTPPTPPSPSPIPVPPSPSPHPGAVVTITQSTTPTNSSGGLTPQQLFLFALTNAALAALQADQKISMQINTRIPTDYTPWTTIIKDLIKLLRGKS